ncbi:MAG: hypothetical protein JO020_26570 [Chloroflexi bacterium]|nr:hypothetical protein [Chloroflexota bacterium]
MDGVPGVQRADAVHERDPRPIENSSLDRLAHDLGIEVAQVKWDIGKRPILAVTGPSRSGPIRAMSASVARYRSAYNTWMRARSELVIALADSADAITPGPSQVR